MVRGPDPEKSAFRFAINRQAQRWKALRPRWVEAVDEASAQAIDAELQRVLDPHALDDATHARDLVEHLDWHLTRLEQVLDQRHRLTPTEMMERARESASANRGRGYAPETIQPSAWRPHPLHAEVNGLEGFIDTITHDVGQRSARVTFAAAPDLKARVTWKSEENDPVVDFLSKRSPLPVVLTLGSIGGVMDVLAVMVQLLSCEITEAGGPRTALPGLKVTVPELPPNAPPEVVEQYRAAQLAASVYDHSIDSRNPADIASADYAQARRNADRTPAQARAELPYAQGWSDDPVNQPGRAPPPPPPAPSAVVDAIRQLYESAGVPVRAIQIVGDKMHLALPGRTISATLPEPLLELLRRSNDKP